MYSAIDEETGKEYALKRVKVIFYDEDRRAPRQEHSSISAYRSREVQTNLTLQKSPRGKVFVPRLYRTFCSTI